QKPPQWGNAFMDAPAELLREYIEDMALWGSTDFVTLGFLWTLDNPFDEEADAESREKLKKITGLAVYAGQLGMKIGYYVYPNTVYRNEVGLRELGGKFRYPQDACPSVPEVCKVLREAYGRMGSDPLPLFLPGKLKEFHDNGVRYIHTYSEGIWDDINNAIVVL
ncbi:MAG: hypothetical protein GX594_06630, partial [Pirellulaceae bacterium]|nr:hypothetical protein [Pirellulaceae bacterium]